MKKSEEQTALENNNAVDQQELLDKLQQLTRSHQRLEEENRFLQEQINLQTANDSEKEKIENRWKDEYSQLRDKLNEQDCLEALLEEKKAQINFLQSQLEQRTRNQYQADQQRTRAVSELEQARQSHEEALQKTEAIKNELLAYKEEIDKLQMQVCEKEEQIAQRHEVLTSKQDHVTYLENLLRETKEQNEMLNAEASDNRDIANTLQQRLLEEQAKVKKAEQRLQSNKQLLRRLYREFSACMDSEEETPVIMLAQESVGL